MPSIPVAPVADLAVRHVGEMRPERPADRTEHLLDGIEWDASHQQQFTGHSRFQIP
jgi:hypothetical protein